MFFKSYEGPWAHGPTHRAGPGTSGPGTQGPGPFAHGPSYDFITISVILSIYIYKWFNTNITTLAQGLSYVGLDKSDISGASDRLTRFAPYLAKAFPETAAKNGMIESDLVDISAMKSQLEQQYNVEIKGRLLLKKDSHLPISGSIKARGGIYEVLTHAEKLATNAGLLLISDN